MGNFLKKNWFVCVLALILAGTSVYYIYDTNKGKLKGKTANGEDVLYTINDQDMTTSAFYDELYKTNGFAAIYNLFTRTVADKGIATTDDLKANAAAQAASIISNYQSQYPTNYQTQLGTSLKQMGYSGFEDLETYLIDYLKSQQIVADYAKANFDELQIRSISYILVKFEDSTTVPEEPTADEAARMTAVDDELASGATFAQTAGDHSEDTTTAPAGGYLGVIDQNSTSLTAPFLEASLALSTGETSEWITAEGFGYFKIHCNASTAEDLEGLAATNVKDTPVATVLPETTATPTPSATAEASASPEATAEAATTYTTTFPEDPYNELISNYDTTLTNKAIWEKANELGIDFKGNEEIRTQLLSYMEIEDDSVNAEATATPEASTEPETTASAEATASAKAN